MQRFKAKDTTTMKNILSLLFTLFVLSTYGQTKNDTIWYAANWQRTTYSKVKAIYGIKDYDETGRGMATYYYKNGTLHSHQNEFKDLKDGLCIWYYNNGKKSTEAYYKNDTVHGELKKYTEEEQLKYIHLYDMGKIVKKTDYNLKTGQPILRDQPITTEEAIMEFPEIEAQFSGGTAAMQEWIATNVQYPQEAITMNEQGRVYLSFIIEPNGEITNIVVERGVSESLDEEAIRLIKSMPNWIPAEVKGKKVRAKCRLPINFTLTGDEEDKKNEKKGN